MLFQPPEALGAIKPRRVLEIRVRTSDICIHLNIYIHVYVSVWSDLIGIMGASLLKFYKKYFEILRSKKQMRVLKLWDPFWKVLERGEVAATAN